MERKTGPSAEQTKRALAAALKSLMAQKPLEKITIRELTDACGMRRQNFYYHFEDIYDLLKWMFQDEAVSLLRRHDGVMLWQDGLLQLFQYLQENRAVCLCALRSLGRSHIKRFFSDDIYEIIHRTVEQISLDISGPGEAEPPVDAELLTSYYVIALSGVVESWLLGEVDRTPEELIAFADTLLQDHVRGAALRIRQRRAGSGAQEKQEPCLPGAGCAP